MKIHKTSYLVRSKHEIQRRHSQLQEYFHEKTPILRREKQNRPIPSSRQSLFQSEATCDIFAIVISYNFNVNENWYT